MNVLGIIAEYNPFHNGHQYHIQKIKELTNADYCIVVMSGNFTQRGEPALLDKYTRTKMALDGGADLVLELPVCYACASAPYFAAGAVALLDRLGVTKWIGFGSECGDSAALQQIAQILTTEPAFYTKLLKQNLKSGLSYPSAQENALADYLEHSSVLQKNDTVLPDSIPALLSSPNNLLGIEYCKAILSRQSPICPITLKRQGSSYQNPSLHPENSSALAIRTALHNCINSCEGMPQLLRPHMPDFVFAQMEKAYHKTFPIFPDMLSFLLHYRLLLEAAHGFSDYLDISEELSARIRNKLPQYEGFSSFCLLLKTKELTYTRISRSLLHILLNIKKNDIKEYQTADWICYGRILGFQKQSTALLSAIKANADIPLISKLSDARKQLSQTAAKQLEQDIQCAHIYNALIQNAYGTKLPVEMQQEIIRA